MVFVFSEGYAAGAPSYTTRPDANYDPPYSTSTRVYEYISENLEKWVDEAIAIRKKA